MVSRLRVLRHCVRRFVPQKISLDLLHEEVSVPLTNWNWEFVMYARYELNAVITYIHACMRAFA